MKRKTTLASECKVKHKQSDAIGNEIDNMDLFTPLTQEQMDKIRADLNMLYDMAVVLSGINNNDKENDTY